jgi:hypothetical protein
MQQKENDIKFLGANVPTDLYDYVLSSGARENRNLGKQTIQLLQEARQARQNHPQE